VTKTRTRLIDERQTEEKQVRKRRRWDEHLNARQFDSVKAGWGIPLQCVVQVPVPVAKQRPLARIVSLDLALSRLSVYR
jgi:hypothetical protein